MDTLFFKRDVTYGFMSSVEVSLANLAMNVVFLGGITTKFFTGAAKL